MEKVLCSPFSHRFSFFCLYFFSIFFSSIRPPFSISIWHPLFFFFFHIHFVWKWVPFQSDLQFQKLNHLHFSWDVHRLKLKMMQSRYENWWFYQHLIFSTISERVDIKIIIVIISISISIHTYAHAHVHLSTTWISVGLEIGIFKRPNQLFSTWDLSIHNERCV